MSEPFEDFPDRFRSPAAYPPALRANAPTAITTATRDNDFFCFTVIDLYHSPMDHLNAPCSPCCILS